MKKLILFVLIISATLFISAQNPKYIATMKKNIVIVDTARETTQLQNSATAFERIAKNEKSEWLPNYYAAYSYVKIAQNTKGDAIDTYCDKADAFIKIADSMSPNNSEVYAIKAQIAAARIGVNPMKRGQKYNIISASLRDKAKELDPANPRPWVLEGETKFYTPAALGGGKNKAKPAFKRAVSLFETFKPASSIHPHWGKEETTYFLKQCGE